MFPPELIEQGLCQEVLSSTLEQVRAGSVDHSWKVCSTPTIGFYRKLHTYLKQQPKLSKVLIGRLYSVIDCNFQEKGSRPDNTYRFVDNIVSSKRQSNDPMLYNIPVVKSTSSVLKKCSQQIEELNAECVELRKKIEASRTQLRAANRTLRDITNDNQHLKRKCELSKVKVAKLKDKSEQLETECARLEIKNLDLQSEEESCDSDTSFQAADVESTFQDIIGHCKYSPEIRKLYYTLLADQVPVTKITDIIRTVLKCFNPSMNVEELRLPKKTCASYMRKEELKIISDTHKAHIICSDVSKGKGIYLNTDGTTKQQKKLGGVVANDMVVSINELPDGKAVSAIEDISREFEKLRRVAEMLGLPNANSINWTLVKSSTSDSASTQKHLNKLIKENRQIDEERFGPATCTVEMLDLIETFCSMHLGVNLRKAFLSGTMETKQDERYHRVDTFVHEFCKLFGKTGGPEYACGVLSFPDFLKLQVSTTKDEERAYYQACSRVNLHRQVGSRYFVSAANAVKILFLKDATIEFLKFTGKDTAGNKLECDVFAKLHDSAELAHLKADSLMYYHVYGDLYMLSKSNDLGLSVLSMNQHYLELHTYLSEVETSPDIVFDPNYHVFQSEKRIYGSDAKVNHRLTSQPVYEKLFDSIEVDCDYLTALLIKGASKMKEKLSSYAQDQLPGGCYWEPDRQVQDILRELKPSNDVCESILGLNDYLTTAIPNLHQMARSNLVQVKKNKTLKWLSNLPEDEQSAIVDLAVKQRRFVSKEYRDEEKMRSQQRQQKMLEENAKRVALGKKLHEEKEKLSQLHLVTSSDELKDELLAIDKETISTTKKKSKKIELLKTQIRIRKKVLCQTVPIVFTTNRKQRPLKDIIKELCDFIDESTLPAECKSFIRNPTSLIGRKVKQRFLDEVGGTPTWYSGTVIDYSHQEKTHCLTYEGESEHCHFDLTLDLLLGDLIVV